MATPRPSRKRYLAALALATVFVPATVFIPAVVFVPILGAQSGLSPQQAPFQNDLLDQLVGAWDITGTIRGAPVHERAEAEWVLGHQFLRVYRKQIEGPSESVVHVGYDTLLHRFVAFRLDNLGGRGGEYPGYVAQKGDQLEFNIDYPTAPWRETWSWDAKEKTWQFLVEIGKKNPKDVTWSTFSSLTLRNIRGGRGGPRSPAMLRPVPPLPPQQPSPPPQ
jgi:hypothetical protein